MAATLYTGTGTSSARSVTGVGFQPDFVWGKGRSVASQHNLFDAVRGSGKRLISNSTAAEETNAAFGYLSSFDSDGFSTLAGSTNNENWNQTSATYVAWSWKAGGTAVSNTAGTITSSVSANTTAGFSVVTYTGTGVNATVGHGLGVAPSLVICKTRAAAQGWAVYHISSGATKYLLLNSTIAATTDANAWNNTAPTSSVFSVSIGSGTGGLTSAYVAYCWAPVAGYSAFGSYTGNGSADGPFIYTGFRPRFLMIKRTDTAGNNWVILDTSRDTYNAAGLYLYPNLSAAEDDYRASTGPIDILSNGLKQRSTLSNVNASGGTYIYACFAENPLRYSNAR
jgi:hypothetical protein